MGADGVSGDSTVSGQPEGHATMHVRCSNGSKFSVHTTLDATVGSFKCLLSEKCDVPAEQQRLIYKGRILKDDKTLESYEIELGNRPTTHFSRDGWNNLTVNFLAQTEKSYDRNQMKNKWDQLKKEWKLWRELKGHATGLGWDPIRKTIDTPAEWWKERLDVIPSAKKFQHADISPELEEKLDMMFSTVVATGELAWTPNSRNFGKESVNERDLNSDDSTKEVEELGTSGPSKKRKDVGNKKTTKKKTMSSTMDEIAQTSRIIGRCMMDPPSIKISSSLHTIPEAIKELEKYTEVM